MLYQARDLRDFELEASDGDIGKIVDFYFDDRFWTVRYLVVETGSWLTGKQVLISPFAVTDLDLGNERIRLDLTKAQIENAPTPETDTPVSQQFEMEYYGYYGWPYYWYGPYAWGAYPYPAMLRGGEVSEEEKESWNPNLRSTGEVERYSVAATDGDIGHVVDFIIDHESWAVRYLVVDPRSWWPGKHVLLAPEWVDAIKWSERTIVVSLSTQAIKEAPEYDSNTEITREYENALYQHYNREGYWGDARHAA